MTEIRFGLIGCGGIANGFHLRDLSQIEGVRVVALADLRREAAEATAERWRDYWEKPFITSDPEELLAREEVDAVIVATHHRTHALLAVKAIQAGKHVLVQKPLTTRMEDADLLVETAQAHPDIRVQCLPFNWTSAYVKACQLLQEGAIGRVCQARRRVAHAGPPRDSWFYNPEIAEYGASFDMGVYAVSGLAGLLGPAVSVSGLVGTFEEGVRIDDNCTWQILYESGAFATAETSWTQLAGVEGTVIYGTEGVLTLGWPGHEPLRLYRRVGGTSFGSKVECQGIEVPKDPPALVHRHFVECLREGKKPLGTPEFARHVTEILLAAHQSHRTGQRVELRTRF